MKVRPLLLGLLCSAKLCHVDLIHPRARPKCDRWCSCGHSSLSPCWWPDKFGLIRSREFVGLRREAKATRVVACPSKPKPDRVKAKGGIFFLFLHCLHLALGEISDAKLLGRGSSSRAPSLFRGVERSVKLSIQSTRIHSNGSGVWPCRSCVFGPRVLLTLCSERRLK